MQGFEYGAELSKPCSESISSGVLNASAQLFGIVFILGMAVVAQEFSTLAASMSLLGCLVIGQVFTACAR